MTTKMAIMVGAVLLLMVALMSFVACSETTDTPTPTSTPAVTPTSTPAPTAPAVPAFPHIFYGELRVDGTPAPVGTFVEARANGEVRGSVTTTEVGIYATFSAQPLLVQGDIEEGAAIEFYADGVRCNEIAMFLAGDYTELNLSYDALVR